MKKKIVCCFIFLIGIIICNSCKREFDAPPIKPAEGINKINIANIKAKYFPDINYRFKSDSNLYCVITADGVSGNLYKEIYVKDVTGALHVKLISNGGFFIGDSIRINLQGSILKESNNVIELDSVDSEKNIVKIASGYNPQPVSLTLSQVLANTSPTNPAQSKLIKITNVEFVPTDRNVSYADADGKSSLKRIIRSCEGQTLAVSTSGYCNFARKLTPSGNGAIMGIVSQYETKMELILRDYTEVNMNGTLCPAIISPTNTGSSYLFKDFDDASLSSGGWTSYAAGTLSWTTSSVLVTLPAGGSYAKATNYPSNGACEMWLISPAMNLSASTAPNLSFVNAYGFGPTQPTPLIVCVSTNYSGGDPANATWTSLTIPTTGGNFSFVNSGNISLSAFKSANTRIAFKYATTGNSSTWEIDNILVKEN